MNSARRIKRIGNYYRVKASRIAAKEGIAALLSKIAAKIIRATFRTTCSLWLMRTIDAPWPSVIPAEEFALDYLVHDKARLIDWLRVMHSKFPWMFFPKEIEAACANGHIFTVIEKHGEIIGYIKVGINNVYVHDFDRTIRIPSGVAFVYDTFVLPAFRGKEAALFALIGTIKHLKDRGYTKLWCHIEKWNTSSLRLFKKAGFKEKGTIRFLTFFTLPLFIKDGYKPVVERNPFLSLSQTTADQNDDTPLH